MRYRVLFLIFALAIMLPACKRHARPEATARHIVEQAKDMPAAITDELEDLVGYAMENNGRISDSTFLDLPEAVNAFYEQNDYRPVWSDTMTWRPLADSMMDYLGGSLRDGLFPGDYHFPELDSLHRSLVDSFQRKDALLWTRAEVLLTDAFMKVARDLKQGRLQSDSSSWHHNPKKLETFFLPMFRLLLDSGRLSLVTDSLQPKYTAYRELKRAIPAFLKNMDRKEYTYLVFPFNRKDTADSVRFITALVKRLREEEIEYYGSGLPDSVTLSNMLLDYQKKKKLTADGRFGAEVVSSLNNNDLEKLKRIAITLDKYKQLPDTLPPRYIWVNLPEYKLFLRDHDSLIMESRIICGKPATPTPLVTSSIYEMIVFPTWTVPESIIKKEMLPALKRNPHYLDKKGMYLLNKKGEKVRADTINWKKYKQGIPFRIQQGSGDDNALGVFKFNFHNPYDVYMHDTDQRHLFRNSKRAFSHGCVRVQEWQRLAAEVLRYDSLFRSSKDPVSVLPDSIMHLIDKGLHIKIPVKNRIPLFLRYISSSASEGRVLFLEDIYGLDRDLRNSFFASKAILPYLKRAL